MHNAVVESAIVVVILAAGICFVGHLIDLVVGGAWVLWRASVLRRKELARELSGLPAEEIRRRLLEDWYLSDYLRKEASIQAFLSRIARGDEKALALEYPRARLYRLLAHAEARAGGTSRPEAVDAISEISGLLQELASRSRSAGGADAR